MIDVSGAIPRLDRNTSHERLEELRRIAKEAREEGQWPQAGQELNNHVHSTYSFSPYNPSQIALMAWTQGLSAVGIVDHDSFAGAAEFVEACETLCLASTCGLELRVNAAGSPFASRYLNMPECPGLFYMTIHGISLAYARQLADFLKPIQEARNRRNQKQLANLNGLLEALGLVRLDWDQDVLAHSMAHEGGSITERHLLAACARRLLASFGSGPDLCHALEGLFMSPLSHKVRSRLSDMKNPHLLYDLIGCLKAGLLPQIFLLPSAEECIPVGQATDFAKSISAIPAYAYLGDVDQSPTGDKKTQAFEDSYLDELLPQLVDWGFQALTFMPPRNSRAQLARVMELCERENLMQISGVDVNSSRQSFRCPELLLPEFRHLLDSTWALVAHEDRVGQDPEAGIFGSRSPVGYGLSIGKHIAHYAALVPETRRQEACL